MAKSLLPLGGFRCVGRSARPLFARPAAMLFQMRQLEAHCCELWTRRLARPGRGRQDMFLLDYLPPAGPGRQPLRPFQRLPRRQVQRDRHGAGNGGAGRAVAPPQVALCTRHRAPPCAACAQRGAEHCCRRAHEGHRMDAAQARVAARALRAWLQPALPAGAGPAVASQPVRDPPRVRKRSRSRSSSPERATRRARPMSGECARRPGEPSDPPPRVSMGGAHSLSGSGMLDGRGELRRPLPLPPPPRSPRGERQGRGGQQGVGRRCRRSRHIAQTAAIRGGGRPVPLPPLYPPPPLLLPGAGGHFWEHFPPADGGPGGCPGPRGGHRPPPRGSGLFFRGGAGEADRPPPHRGRLRGGRGGDVRRSGGEGPPPQGQSQGIRESPCPPPPHRRGRSGQGEKGWGSRDAPCRPCAMSTGPRHASHVGGTGGCGIAAAAITRGIPGCWGEDNGACRCRGGGFSNKRACCPPEGRRSCQTP